MLQFLRTAVVLRWVLGAVVCAVGMTPVAVEAQESVKGPDRAFFKTHCFDCHQGKDAEAGVDLEALTDDLSDSAVALRWGRVFDRIHSGEMPPPDSSSLESKDRAAFLKQTRNWLNVVQKARFAKDGRVRGRRLTAREVERTLHDLLGIDIPLQDQLPPEDGAALFSTMVEGQSISHFQLERHLAVVDIALDEAFQRALQSNKLHIRDFNAQQICRKRPQSRTREPEMLNGQAVVWNGGVIYYGRIPATTAPRNGWYRFTIRVSGLNLPPSGGVWSTVQAGFCVSSAPLLTWVGAFEAGSEPREYTFETWLPRGHMLEVRPGDITLKRARFAGGQIGTGEGEPQMVPGIAIDGIRMEQFHHGPDDEGIRSLLLGDLEVIPEPKSDRQSPVSENPEKDVQRLVTDFASRAFRRPVTKEEAAPYIALSHAALNDGRSFTEALRTGYRAVLCSPRFLYFIEQPGRLDDFALATRLSYFLTGSMPDKTLRDLAAAGQLQNSKVLHEQVDRLLTGTSGRRFVQDFSGEWLELNQIDFTTPDRKLIPDFDAIVQHSMLDETHAYLEEMLQKNLGVTHLVDSDFTFLNSRLSRFYKVGDVKEETLQRVKLQPEDRRGGLLTQGAILKVTANGTNTSPVIRGVWICERILGLHIPPPPDNLPGIEPDIRGTTTIREMLAKHSSDESCATCHVKIDPPGFALENYDAAGRWRDRYVQLVNGRVTSGAVIDASYTMPDQTSFQDINGFRQLVRSDPRQLTKNLAEKLLAYGTGTAVVFADRDEIEKIVQQTSGENYGFRAIIHAVVASPTFRSK